MPGYKTHITVSSVGGVMLSLSMHHFWEIPISSSLLAGGLCAIGGMVPDIDSKTSQSFRHTLAIVAGFSSLMLVSRLRNFDLDTESVALIGGGNFLFCWIVIGWLIRRFTVHRGMCHSLTAVVIGSEIIYLLSSGDVVHHFLNAASMGLGMLIHLILDELNSFKIGSWGIIRAKKSLGTALKIFDFDNLKSSIVAFTLVFFLTGAVIRERSLTKELEDRGEAQQASEYIAEHSEDVLEQLKDNNPEDFDRAVIYWAQEHDLVLQPEDVDSKNQKWEELKQMVIPEN